MKSANRKLLNKTLTKGWSQHEVPCIFKFHSKEVWLTSFLKVILMNSFQKNDRASLSKFTWEETGLKQVVLNIINITMLT